VGYKPEEWSKWEWKQNNFGDDPGYYLI
jgi:hypothetical protein